MSRHHRVLTLSILSALGVLLVALWIAEFSARPLTISDVFWQVRTGELILSSGAIPDRDPFSYTVPGVAWNNHEWGAETLAALIHRELGWGGLRFAVMALMLAIVSGLSIAATRSASAAFAFPLVALFWVTSAYKMLPVPQALSMGIFLAVVLGPRGGRLASSAARWAALGAVLLIWGNLTAESLMVLPFLVADQLLYRLAPRADESPPPPRSRHALILLLVCLAPLVNPPASSVLDYALMGTATNLHANVEFAPLWAPAGAVDALGKWVARAIVLLYLGVAGGRLLRATDRLPVLREIAPGLLAVGLATSFERNLWLLLIPALSMAIWAAQREAIALTAVATAAAVFTASATTYGWSPIASARALASAEYRAHHIDHSSVPADCIDPLAGRGDVHNLYTLRMWASYAIWRLPEARVFIDGRNREYPAALHEIADSIWIGAPGALAYLDATGTDTVVAWPGWGDLPGIQGGPWKRIAQGRNCATYRR